jgi:trigger factor
VEGLTDDPEVLKATARETATRRIKESLLLEAVARQENLTVTDEETEAEIQTLARLYRQEPSAMRTSLEDPVRGAGLKGRILERKALDFLMAQATISEAYHLITPA